MTTQLGIIVITQKIIVKKYAVGIVDVKVDEFSWIYL